jgi:hypothetical protein
MAAGLIGATEGMTFNPEGAMLVYQAMMAGQGLENHAELNTGCVVNVTHRPAFDVMFFFVDPSSPWDNLKGFTCSTMKTRDELRALGYHQVSMSHLPADPRHLPAAVVPLPPTSAGAQPAAPNSSQPAAGSAPAVVPPLELVKVPVGLPAIQRGADAPTAARQLTDWFEQGVTIDGTKYSPMWRWSKEERTAQKFDSAKHSNELRKRSIVYIFIRGQDLDPNTIKETYGVLRTTAEKAITKDKILSPAEHSNLSGWAWAASIAREYLGVN